jgi:hypothetical protein
MEGGRIFPKTSAPLSLMTTYRMSLISARSISLDSTFKQVKRHKRYLNFKEGKNQKFYFNPDRSIETTETLAQEHWLPNIIWESSSVCKTVQTVGRIKLQLSCPHYDSP